MQILVVEGVLVPESMSFIDYNGLDLAVIILFKCSLNFTGCINSSGDAKLKCIIFPLLFKVWWSNDDSFVTKIFSNS